MSEITDKKAWVNAVKNFLYYMQGINECDSRIIAHIIERINDSIRNGNLKPPSLYGLDSLREFSVDATVVNQDQYFIVVEDGEGKTHEFIVDSDCKNAYNILLSNNTDIYRSYELDDISCKKTIQEELSNQFAPMDDSQIALLQDIYNALNIVSIGFDRFLIPEGKNCPKGSYPRTYGCKDVQNKRYLLFSNDKDFVISIACESHKCTKSSIKMIIVNDKVRIITTSNSGEVIPYEEYEASEEIISLFKEIVKVLKNHEFDVSELPLELTDQAQYS